jgi:hypothetical protein
MDTQTWDSLTNYKKWGTFDGDAPYLERTFFAPYDDVHSVIMAVIGSAKQTLYVAMYSWDDPAINDAVLKAAQNPAIRVKVALDSSQASGRGETPLLKKWPSADYLDELVIGQSSRHAISHDKLIVSDDCRISGSTNLSASGQTLQNNECTASWNAKLALEAQNVITRIFSEMVAADPTQQWKKLLGN